MKILLACDSFKNSMTSKEMIDIVAKYGGSHKFIKKPLADGGEGSVETLRKVIDFERIEIKTLDAYQKNLESFYLFDSVNKAAYIESAMICGIEGILLETLDIMESSSIGVGIAIEDALKYGAKDIYLFLGGTASNDGGLGILKAFGYSLLSQNKKELEGKTMDLVKLSLIKGTKRFNKAVTVHFISDVENTLLGDLGATFVYGKQKGANDNDLVLIEESMQSYQKLMKELFLNDYSAMPSSGPAVAFHML